MKTKALFVEGIICCEVKVKESKPKSKYDVGTVFETNLGGKAIVIEYKNSREVLVRFLNTGYETWTRTAKIQTGTIRDWTIPTLFGIGYTDEGKYPGVIVTESRTKTAPSYNAWRNMLRRCYDENDRYMYPTYAECTVNPVWHYYQTFAEFYHTDPWRQDGWHLDKDLLVKGNKVYSPETCVFAPAAINCLVKGSESRRGNSPIGVFYNEAKRKYIAHYRKGGKSVYIGRFDDPVEAFYATKEKKEALMKSIADEWRDRIDPRLYEALYEYTVEITD